MDVEEFVLQSLPPAPARVLEVGCGQGELASGMAGRGYQVIAIDPEAPTGAIFRRETLESFEDDEPFAAVVGNRSLHHIENLAAAVDKIHDLLSPGGLVVLNEFAWDQMDESTAKWYLEHVTEPHQHDHSLLPDNFPHAWIEEHHDLHTSQVMMDALQARFSVDSFEWVPYIARHYLERDDLIEEEAELIQAGAIKALGFRYVGRRD